MTLFEFSLIVGCLVSVIVHIFLTILSSAFCNFLSNRLFNFILFLIIHIGALCYMIIIYIINDSKNKRVNLKTEKDTYWLLYIEQFLMLKPAYVSLTSCPPMKWFVSRTGELFLELERLLLLLLLLATPFN